MKRYVEEGTGKIVNLLTGEEAKRIITMYINNYFGSEKIPESRKRLLSYLVDFLNYSKSDEKQKFVDYIKNYEKELELKKEEKKVYDKLVEFFTAYSETVTADIDISKVAKYIMEKSTKEKLIDEKKEKSQEFTLDEKILDELFSNGFNFSNLASEACKAWEKKLNDALSSKNGEIFVSLDDDIAYHDLLDFVKTGTFATEIEIKDKKNEDKVEKLNEKTEKEATVSYEDNKVPTIENLEIKDDALNTDAVETKKVEAPIKQNLEINNVPNENKQNKQENIPLIQIQIPEDDENDENLQPKDKEERNTPNDKVDPLSIKDATENVSLNDSVDFFNNVLDQKISNSSNGTNSNFSSDDEEDESIFRD